jgi:hypothetical protein
VATTRSSQRRPIPIRTKGEGIPQQRQTEAQHHQLKDWHNEQPRWQMVWRAVQAADGEQSRRWWWSRVLKARQESRQWQREENQGKPATQQSGIDQNEDRSKKTVGEERKKLTLICGSEYHVMNSACIHLRARAWIYTCTEGRNIQRTFSKNTIIKKTKHI